MSEILTVKNFKFGVESYDMVIVYEIAYNKDSSIYDNCFTKRILSVTFVNDSIFKPFPLSAQCLTEEFLNAVEKVILPESL